ncbi:hypothetical protein CSC2_42320 [Clostridium zeae]|uniref:Glycosyltransferase RgtA/B/C/D-like domain-containing protein n=1 Tax=Clostridium zeae TaxID=2759022 RepID=A0ABQ1EFX2_9CLOT|nr:hypothetical protein [Clostridium zeae]GFZ33706.1 hypothetical protein CSC2_42320 [Clostridium zeae]
MFSKVNHKYKLIFCIIVICIISIIVGTIKKTDVEQYKLFKLYTVDKDHNVSDSVDKAFLKKLNTLNKTFSEKYKGDFKVNVLAQEGINAKYRIRFNSVNGVDDKTINRVYDDYASMLKSNNIIFHISPLEQSKITYSNIKLNSMIINIFQAILYSFLIMLLYKFVKPQGNYENIFGVSSIVLFTIATIFNLYVALVFTGIFVLILMNIIKRDYKYKNTFIRITILALIVRVVVAAAMLIYNYYKYRTVLSYTQTDEIFYYSTSDYIYQALVNFSWPDLKTITGIDQYGYNLFMGIVKFINHGDILISIKIINILASVTFVLLLFKFVYNITENEHIAKLSALMMAVMPTFAVFSSFALRDIFISINIFLIFYEVISISKAKNKLLHIIGCVLLIICLWYLRRYALLLTLMLIALYVIIKFLISRKINILIILISLLILLIGLVAIASKLYAFNIFSVLKAYIFSQGILKFFSGVILSLVNLDFLINSGTTLYTSTKSIILRVLYPETLFLVLSFPIMCLGLIKAIKRDVSFVITTLTMFIGFITIYKMQYGGWFLRTQLQIFPFQYIFISWGLITLIYDSNNKISNYLKKILNMI